MNSIITLLDNACDRCDLKALEIIYKLKPEIFTFEIINDITLFGDLNDYDVLPTEYLDEHANEISFVLEKALDNKKDNVIPDLKYLIFILHTSDKLTFDKLFELYTYDEFKDQTPLLVAIEHEQIYYVEKLIEKYSDQGILYRAAATALDREQYDVADIILQKLDNKHELLVVIVADFNTWLNMFHCDNQCSSIPICSICEYKCPDAIKKREATINAFNYLLNKHDVDPFERDVLRKLSALDAALFHEDFEIVNLLIDRYGHDTINDKLASYLANGISEESCAICMNALGGQYFITPCNHCFHYKCLEKWYQKKENCPSCRADFILYDFR